eukprot:CAMPEP_0175262544 /NCGR_PEP_ID=MMETSP0093-20121207/41330_1 /TAXON_ID=311494 /ORGANISM="Alexandrium monilatum, Strain CCMP3105" /LENGTH=165 /DNA_ID=CAMNT_0016557037 /DNA_START=37 /DNA_END=534 /DNA_ORIENTATION=-
MAGPSRSMRGRRSRSATVLTVSAICLAIAAACSAASASSFAVGGGRAWRLEVAGSRGRRHMLQTHAAAQPEPPVKMAVAEAVGQPGEEAEASGNKPEELADPTSGGVFFVWFAVCLVLYYVYVDIALGARCYPSGLNMWGRWCGAGSVAEVVRQISEHPLYLFVS